MNASETQFLVNLLPLTFFLFLSAALTLSRPLDRLPTQGLSQKSAFEQKIQHFRCFQG